MTEHISQQVANVRIEENGNLAVKTSSAFELFRQENEPVIRKDNRGLSDENIKNLLENQWKKLDEPIRQSYQNRLQGLQQNQASTTLVRPRKISGHRDSNSNDSIMSSVNNQETTSSTANRQGKCIRNGCQNDAVESPEWDMEYCSASCCVKHCADIFHAWTECCKSRASAQPETQKVPATKS